MGMRVLTQVESVEQKVNFKLLLSSILANWKLTKCYNFQCTNQLTLQYAIALMGYADELETTALELNYNHGVTQHSKGNGYSQVKIFLSTWSLSLIIRTTNSHTCAKFLFWFQVVIGTDDVYKSAEIVNLITKELGGEITQPPSLDSQINSKITSFLDPDGWKIVSFPSKKICHIVSSFEFC